MTSPDQADRAFDRYLLHRHPEDLARVFDLTAPRLLLLAGHLTGGTGDAEDLLQATFLRAMEIAPARFERGRPVLPWLCGILVNEVRKLRRSGARRPDVEWLGASAVDEPGAAAELEELRAAVEEAVGELPAGYTRVLTLRLIHGLTPAEIAHALGLPPETVKTRIRRGVERLRTRLPVGFAALLASVVGSGRSLTMVREAVMSAAGAGATAGATAGAAAVTVATTAAVRRGVGRTIAKWVSAATVVGAVSFGVYELVEDDTPPLDPAPRIAESMRGPERDDVSRRVPVLPPAAEQEQEAPPDAPALYASLEGRFRDRRGAVEGVRLSLLRLHPDALVAPWSALPAAVREPSFLVAEAETDLGGRFVFDRIPPGGVWLLRVEAPGRPAFIQLVAQRPPLDERVDLGMQELPWILGVKSRVVDESLRAVPDATVRHDLVDWSPPDGSGFAGEVLAAWNVAGALTGGLVVRRTRAGTTVVEIPAWVSALRGFVVADPIPVDGRGRFVWRSPHGSRERLRIEAPGFSPESAEPTLADPPPEYDDVVLTRLQEVEITVVDAAQVPVAEAEVALARWRSGEAAVAMERVGVTGVDGVLRAPFVDGVGLLAAARSAAGEPWHVVELPPGLGRTIRLPLRHPVSLRCVGRADTPIEGVEVRLVPGERCDEDGPGTLALYQLGAVEPLDLTVRVARIDEGELVIGDVPEGAWILVVAAPGYATRAVPIRVSGPVRERIELAECEPFRVEVFDSGFRPLRGLALAGLPIARSDAAHMLAAVIGRTGREADCVFPRDRWGRFALGILDPGRGSAWLEVDSSAEHGRIVVRGTGGIDGVFASLHERFAPTTWLLDARLRPAPGAPVLEAPVFVQPGVDGVVRIAELPPGKWDVRSRPMPAPIREIGSVFGLLWPEDEELVGTALEVRAGSSTGFRLDPMPAVDAPAEERRTFRGRITLDGSPDPRVRLSVVLGGSERALFVDPNGAFDLGEPVEGEVGLVLRWAGADGLVELWRATTTVAAGAAPLEIDLATTPFSAQISAVGGQRAAGSEVVLVGETATVPPGSVRLRLRADPAGFVSFDKIPAGTYEMRVTNPELGWLRRKGVVFGGVELSTGMSVRLRALLRMSGSVADVGVEVPRTSEIELVRVDEDGVALRRVAVCGEGGAFTAAGLLPGRYRATLKVALRFLRLDGAVVLVAPSVSGIEVPLREVTVGDADAAGVVLTRGE